MGMNSPSDYAYFYNSDGGDRIYDSDSMCDWLTPFFTTGVFNGSLQVLANDPTNLGVTVQTGFVNIEGKVKHFYQPTELTIDLPHALYDRIDTIVVQRNDSERDFIIKVVKGEASSAPVPVAPVRDGVIYELVLAEVYVRAGESEITQAEITDKRMDTTVCGWVAATVEEINFEQIYAQFQAFTDIKEDEFMEWFNNLHYVLDGDVAGHLQNEIDELKGQGAGSILNISCREDWFYGADVTITNGTETIHTRLDEFGRATVKQVPFIGTIMVTAVAQTPYGEQTARGSIYTDCFSVYDVQIAMWLATVNITVSDSALYDHVVTVKKDGVIIGTTTLVDDTGTFYLTTGAGAYTFTVTENDVPYTSSLEVTTEGEYSVTINYWAATINVTTTSPEFIGQTVVLKNSDSQVVGSAPFNSSGSVTFIVGEVDTYTVSVTYQGDEYEEEVEVTEETAYSALLKYNRIYGVEWDGTATTAWTRTDSAVDFVDPVPAINNGSGSSPFDDILPWSGMTKVEDPDAGTLVAIPKYYYKWTRNGSSMKLQISENEFNGSFVSPAHADRGDGQGERDTVYVGRYKCASTYKSTTGVGPKASTTRANFRTNIHNLGSDIWQNDYAMFWTIMMLYLVEYADWNSQAKIGYGCGSSSSAENSGLTDSMQYHTGTNAASRTTYGHTQYRYIEDLWGNVYELCDGIYFSSSNIYCIKNPADFSDITGGTLVGTRTTSDGWISGWTSPSATGFEYALYPNAFSGSSSTYVCDYCGNSGGAVLYVGGRYSQAQEFGAFYLSDSVVSISNTSTGSRLMKLPNNS